MKRVLIMVLSFDEGYYRSLYYASRSTWDSVEVEGVKTVYFFGHEGATQKFQYDEANRTLWTGTGEGLTAIGYKTIAAFEWALENEEFDYIIRVNASTYVNKKLIHEYVQNLPTERLYKGIGAPYEYKGETINFAWGPAYLLSKDLVDLICAQTWHWNHGQMDDVSMGLFMKDLNVELANTGSMASIDIRRGSEPPVMFLTSYNNEPDAGGIITDLSELNKWTLPMIRVKQDWDRSKDVELMKGIFNVINK